MMKNDGSITYTRMDTTIHSAILTVEAEKKDLSESLTVVVRSKCPFKTSHQKLGVVYSTVRERT